MQASKYRPDIDGLRGVAVLAVIAFHCHPAWARGGGGGVDVFFVISGFLISTLIFRGLRSGSFSFSDFYERRARRIFPALILVLLATLALGWVFLLPDEFQSVGGNVASGAAFLSNISAVRVIHAGVHEPFRPLLHLWSLGIEEQYYLAWPLAALLMSKLRPRLTGPVVVLMLFSYGLHASFMLTDPTAAFDLPQNRVWELMIGGALASLAPGAFGGRRDAKACLGSALIALSIFVFPQGRLFSAFWAVPPALGAFLLIAAGEEAWVNRVLLAHPAMVGIGLISYPLYLWHWPLLTFARIVSPDSDPGWRNAAAVAATFVLSWGTYELVEKPIRFPKNHPLVGVVGLCAAMAVIVPLGLLASSGLIAPRLQNELTSAISAAKEDRDFPATRFDQGKLTTNRLTGSTVDAVLFLGDGHAEQYWPRLESLYRTRRPRYTAIFATFEGCPPFPRSGVASSGHGYDLYDCDRVFSDAMDLARRPDVKRVVFGSQWELWLSRPDVDQRMDDLKSQLLALRAAGKRCALILPNPAGYEFDPRRMIGSRFSVAARSPAQAIDRKSFEADVRPVTDKLRALAAQTGSEVIDPLASLCDGTACPTFWSGKPAYRDADHLRPFYAIERAGFIDRIVEE